MDGRDAVHKPFAVLLAAHPPLYAAATGLSISEKATTFALHPIFIFVDTSQIEDI